MPKLLAVDIKGLWEGFYDDAPEALVDYHGREDKVLDVFIDFERIDQYNSDLGDAVLDQPDMAIEGSNKVLTEILHNSKINTRFYNIGKPNRIDIRHLRAENLSQLVCIEGMVRRASEVKPYLKVGGFKCKACGTLTFIEQEGTTLSTPLECDEKNDGCGKDINHTSFLLDPKNSVFVNTQQIEILEQTENLRGGQQPERISTFLEGCLTNDDVRVGIGDRISVVGIYRVRESQNKKLEFDTFLDALTVSYLEHDFESIEITEEDKTAILEMSKNPRLIETLAGCIAPEIYGYELEKQATLMQLFGGCSVEGRDDIHILMIGDPGVAKTQYGMAVKELAPRVVYTSGGTTSGVGLTAATVRDETTGRWMVEAGAVVLADKGLLIADELDKMTDKDRGAMHEAMEQQTVTVAKAGITTSLPARCAILAIMNPRDGRFNSEDSILSQIKLPPALLSRFDLIFALRDKVDEEVDLQISEMITQKREGLLESKEYPTDLVRKYIAYAKINIREMSFSTSAKKILYDYYRTMRKKYFISNVICITPRQQEALNRMAEAHAKARLSSVMEDEDAKFACMLMTYYLNSMASDDGTIDIDKLMTGVPHSDRQKRDVVRFVLNNSAEGADEKELYEAVSEKMSKLDLERTLEKLSQGGEVFKDHKSKYHLINN